jgi:hypothetical protein
LWLWCAFVLYEFLARGPFAVLFIRIYLFAAAAFTLFSLWAVVSGVVWSATRNAKIQAAVTRDVVMRTLSPRAAPVELPTARTGIVCAKCGDYAAVPHCDCHNESICWRCAVKTDTAECAYTLTNRRLRIDGRERGQAVYTSPLSGMR